VDHRLHYRLRPLVALSCPNGTSKSEDAIAITERLWARGRGSAAKVEMRVFAVYWLDGEGNLTKREAFTTPDEARSAV
jgi:hypothetical protein